MIKHLFENQDATGYRKSNPNIRFDLKEIGYASAKITDQHEKPSDNIKDYFLRMIEGNRVIGSVKPGLVDLFSDDFEIEVPLQKGDKVKLSDFPELTIEYIKAISADDYATFIRIIPRNLQDNYQFEINVKDSMIEQCGKINWFLVSPTNFINRKL